jgi:CRP-like cAMP-binding protein
MTDPYPGENGRLRLIERLCESAVIAGDPDAAADVAAKARLVAFEPGTVMLAEGGQDDGFLFVLEGCVSVQVNDRHMVLRSAVTHIGELAVLDPTARHSATVRAVDRVQCARLTEAEFSEIASIHPEIWKALAVQTLNRLGEDKSARTEGMPGL